jgi:hypothetical protein
MVWLIHGSTLRVLGPGSADPQAVLQLASLSFGRTTLARLLGALKPGGWYAVETTGTQFAPANDR